MNVKQLRRGAARQQREHTLVFDTRMAQWREPNVEEKEAMMGYPIGVTSHRDQEGNPLSVKTRTRLLGNAFDMNTIRAVMSLSTLIRIRCPATAMKEEATSVPWQGSKIPEGDRERQQVLTAIAYHAHRGEKVWWAEQGFARSKEQKVLLQECKKKRHPTRISTWWNCGAIGAIQGRRAA